MTSGEGGGRARRLTADRPGAIQVFAVEGDGLAGFLAANFRPSARAAPAGLMHGWIVDRDEIIDEVLLLREEDGSRCEVSLHGGPAIARRFQALLAARGFSEAAAVAMAPHVLQGEVEAALLAARAREPVLYFTSLLDGRMQRRFEEILGIESPAVLQEEIETLLARAPHGQALANPPRVLITGPVNAGKSTLFNRLCRRPRAIVDAEPGTTRDLIEVELELHGHPFLLVDSAGLRETVDPIERLGVERSRAAGRTADLVLFLEPADRLIAGQEPVPAPQDAARNRVAVASRADLVSDPQRGMIRAAGWLPVSALSGEGMPALEGRLMRASPFAASGTRSEILPFTGRQVDLLRRARVLLPGDPNAARGHLRAILS